MKMRPKNEFMTKKTVCLEQRNYASQENFTQSLVVMVETFRRSVKSIVYSVWCIVYSV